MTRDALDPKVSAEEYRWYTFTGFIEDCEYFQGPYADRQTAIERGREIHGEPFSIVESAFAVFDHRAAEQGFDLDAIFERIAENWWAVSEDGLDFDLSEAQRHRLTERLSKTFADFIAEEGVNIFGLLLDSMRNQEFIGVAHD